MADAVMKDEDLRLTDDDNVSNNMNGIKSEKLYDFLQTLSTCKTNALNNFKETTPKDLLPLLLEHLLVTIPNELFLKNSAQDQERLQEINSWITEKFLKLDQFPFTILRICQLCYDPFKYFKINELTKFVNAIEKCCVVTSALDINDDKDPEVKNNDKSKNNGHIYNGTKTNNATDDTSNIESGNNDEDVSLVKIPWIDEVEADPEFPQFLRDIDSIMSVNFGYDDGEEDEDEDMDGVQLSMENDNDIMMGNSSNVIVEEYYENDGDNEADLNNYNGLAHSNISITDKELDVEDEADEDYNENASDNASDEDDDDEEENGLESNYKAHQEVDDEPPVQVGQGQRLDESKTPRKRKPTELDIFDYNDNSTLNNNNELTTPKKHKQDDSTLVIESPIITTTVENKSVSVVNDKRDVSDTEIHLESKAITDKKSTLNDTSVAGSMVTGTSMLYSPCDENVVNVNTEKIRAITDINETSPLGNKTR
ncbi:serine/threonine-protein phosphatase 4 regulatory subunit 2 [Maudiozyma exigua]|uniref:Serine/threonine-protein phosphatase 4 regulatory subunit 2 n=1 Tax=Maudiozyma exigua TaxID=34358 RepID=A0A9P7BCU9_MAUEX|nr:serine/threonine-protein phosphatase 4 regulatory subunit 2 [Kazachstania exigua]